MAVREPSRYEEYRFYAEHCLELVRIATNRKSRVIQRQMAAEWLSWPICSPLRNNLQNDDGGRLSWRPLSFQTKRAMSLIGPKRTSARLLFRTAL